MLAPMLPRCALLAGALVLLAISANASCPWLFHDCRLVEDECLVRLEHKCRCNSSSGDVQRDPSFDCFTSSIQDYNVSAAEFFMTETNGSVLLTTFCNVSTCTIARQWCPWGPWIHTGAVNATHQGKVRYSTRCCHPQTLKVFDKAPCRHERFQELMFAPYSATSNTSDDETFYEYFRSIVRTPARLFQFCMLLIVFCLCIGSARRVIMSFSARAQRSVIARRSSSELEELAELENWRRRCAPTGTVSPSAIVGHSVELSAYQHHCLEPSSMNGDTRHSDRIPFATRA